MGDNGISNELNSRPTVLHRASLAQTHRRPSQMNETLDQTAINLETFLLIIYIKITNTNKLVEIFQEIPLFRLKNFVHTNRLDVNFAYIDVKC